VANYTLLRQGDHLPTVAVLQELLNRTGAELRVDGAFGPRTHADVIDFQRSHGIHPDGVAGEDTWPRLVASEQLPIIDCVDVFDEGLYHGDAQAIIQAGGHPILLGGMSRGVAQAARLIAASSENVFLLRFIGHGRAGLQGVAVGKGGWEEIRGKRKIWHSFGEQRSSLHWVNAKNAGTLGLQGIFGPYGSVELHGCHVAAGPKGRTFVATLAKQLGVPVSAGTASQVSTFRFDGPTFTAFPRGETMKEWCATLPDFASMSVR